jgi:predicted transcriptional regulator
MRAIRSREQIIADMLKLVMEPSKQTFIMFRANLSYTQLRLYLDYLSKRQLVIRRDGMWIATDKGREYLAAYAAMTRLLDDERAAQSNAIPVSTQAR